MDEAAVRSAPLFAELSDDSYRAVRERTTELTFRRGEEIFHEGSQGHRMFVIGSGKVKLGHMAPDGREHLLASLGPGGILGELSRYDPGKRSPTATGPATSNLAELSHPAPRRVGASRSGASQHA